MSRSRMATATTGSTMTPMASSTPRTRAAFDSASAVSRVREVLPYCRESQQQVDAARGAAGALTGGRSGENLRSRELLPKMHRAGRWSERMLENVVTEGFSGRQLGTSSSCYTAESAGEGTGGTLC